MIPLLALENGKLPGNESQGQAPPPKTYFFSGPRPRLRSVIRKKTPDITMMFNTAEVAVPTKSAVVQPDVLHSADTCSSSRAATASSSQAQ